MSTALFLETLKRAELGKRRCQSGKNKSKTVILDKYYGNLTSFGVQNLDALTQLTMQDYGHIGLHSMEDRKRKKLFLNQIHWIWIVN